MRGLGTVTFPGHKSDTAERSGLGGSLQEEEMPFCVVVQALPGSAAFEMRRWEAGSDCVLREQM